MSTTQSAEEMISKESQSNPEKKKYNIKDILTTLLILILLCTWVYIIWDKNNTRELVQQKDNLITTSSAQRDELQKELEDATMRYDIIKTSNSKKDSAISVKDKEIEEKKSRIRGLLSKLNTSKAELTEAKNLLSTLNLDIEGYKAQIAILEGQKTALTNENQLIASQRDRIKKDYDSSIEEIKNRENVIDIGSTLHASNFSIVGLDQKGNGKLKETSNAKKVDKLRISFDLDENMITTSGSKLLYIIISDPTGKVCSEESMGSGKFSTREGEIKMFTQKMDINYIQNKRQTVSFDWKSSTNFTIGNYKIEVYNNGFKVGEGSRPLKKGGLFG